MKTEKGHAPRGAAPVIAGLEPPELIDGTGGEAAGVPGAHGVFGTADLTDEGAKVSPGDERVEKNYAHDATDEMSAQASDGASNRPHNAASGGPHNAASDAAADLLRQLRAHYAGKQFEFGWASLCKMTVPDGLDGMTVLDIGCRRGRGVYKLSERVGDSGRAIGLDWSLPYLTEARDWSAHAAQKTGLSRNNMQFICGFPEALDSAGLADESVDMVWVNSVINLAFDRPRALREIARVLKPGGALVCETVTADAPRDADVVRQAIAIGNSVQAAPFEGDFLRELAAAGLQAPECLERFAVAVDAGFKPGYTVPVVETDEAPAFTAQVLRARLIRRV